MRTPTAKRRIGTVGTLVSLLALPAGVAVLGFLPVLAVAGALLLAWGGLFLLAAGMTRERKA